jgi:uncharacterized protein
MAKVYSYVISRDGDKPIAADFHTPEKGSTRLPLLIFLHGFKGFKDWGHFPLACQYLTRSGFSVLRFNFSHNGTRPDQLTEFADLEAFGRNTFSRELDEVSFVIDDLMMRGDLHPYMDFSRIGIIGHSRGGGIAILAAQADSRIRAVATWAAVSDFESRVNPPELKQWEKDGLVYSHNARTGQDMPLYFSLREDFYVNQQRLNIREAVTNLPVPLFVAHGRADESVSITEAQLLTRWNPFAEWLAVPNANHTFGGKHPWEGTELPAEMVKVLNATVAFFRREL